VYEKRGPECKTRRAASLRGLPIKRRSFEGRNKADSNAQQKNESKEMPVTLKGGFLVKGGGGEKGGENRGRGWRRGEVYGRALRGAGIEKKNVLLLKST